MNDPSPQPVSGLTIGTVLGEGVTALEQAGVTSPRLDAELLLAHVLDVDKTTLFLHPERPVDPDTASAFNKLISRRSTFEPVAYLLGVREFYGIDFAVTNAVLIPRPETELIIDEALRRYDTTPINVLDIGAGSGALPVTLAIHRPHWQFVAVDISKDALRVAVTNAKSHNVACQIELLASDLFDQLPPDKRFDLIVANPPYIKEEERSLPPDVARFEPATALYSGSDGLTMIRRIVGSLSDRLTDGGVLLMEIGYGQIRAVKQMADESEGLRFVTAIPDLAGIDRVVIIEKSKEQ
jgi:release factor glutamine methyltransferase